MLSSLVAAACDSKVNNILSTMKSKGYSRFCTHMLPIKTSTKVVSSRYTSTITSSLSTVFETVNTTNTSTNCIFHIASTRTVTITAEATGATPETKLERAGTSTSVSTPLILRTYSSSALTAACSCWSLNAPSVTRTIYLAPTTVTRNATTTFILSKTAKVTTVSSTSRFVAAVGLTLSQHTLPRID